VTPPVLGAQRRLQQVLGLSPEMAARAVAETLDALTLDVDGYITARHVELRDQGLDNSEIYTRIAAELPSMRFAAKRLTTRQIRRRIYG
jgi:hypothetical protein